MDCYIAFKVYTPTFYKNIDIFFYQGAIGELQVNIPVQLLHSGKKKKMHAFEEISIECLFDKKYEHPISLNRTSMHLTTLTS